MIFRTETNSADCDVQRRGRMAGTAAIAVVLTVALAGCTTGDADAEPTSQAESGAPASAAADPSASPSPEQAESAEPDDPEAIIEQRTADAIERYKEYVQIKDEFEQRGESAYTKLDGSGYLGSHEMREYEKEWGAGLEEDGKKQTGTVVVKSIESVEYDGDPLASFNGHEVKFTTCLDTSGVDYVDSNGKKVPGKRTDQMTTGVTMRGTPFTVNGERKPIWSISLEYVVADEC